MSMLHHKNCIELIGASAHCVVGDVNFVKSIVHYQYNCEFYDFGSHFHKNCGKSYHWHLEMRSVDEGLAAGFNFLEQKPTL